MRALFFFGPHTLGRSLRDSDKRIAHALQASRGRNELTRPILFARLEPIRKSCFP